MGYVTRAALVLEKRFALNDTRFGKMSAQGKRSDGGRTASRERHETLSKEGSVSAAEMFLQEGERRVEAEVEATEEWSGNNVLARYV